jgi:hypothetical protein
MSLIPDSRRPGVSLFPLPPALVPDRSSGAPHLRGEGLHRGTGWQPPLASTAHQCQISKTAPSGFQSQGHYQQAAGGTEHLPQLGRHPERLCQLSWWAALTQHLLATDIEILPGRRNPERRDLVPQEESDLTDGLTRSPHWPWKRAAAGRSRNSRCSGRDRGVSVVRNRSIRRFSLLRWRDVIPADQAAAADR